MIRERIMELASSDPRLAQAVDLMEAQVARMPIVPEDLDEAIQLLEFVLQNPDKYQEVRAAAIQDGVIEENMVPPEYDQVFIISLLVALYGLQDRIAQQGYAQGGLAVAARKLQTGGRGGDTELVHVNRREAEMLRRMGGAGTVNPNTGLREYKSGKQILGAVLPIALNFIAPGIGTAIGSAFTASTTLAPIIGGAIIGGASSAITGGDPLRGALMGGLGGGLGKVVGGAANRAFDLGLGQMGQNILGSSLVGGVAGAASGEGFGRGLLRGAAGELVSTAAGQVGPNVGAGGRTFGQMLTAGYDPKTAAVAGTLGGLFSATRPAEAAVESFRRTPTLNEIDLQPQPGDLDYSIRASTPFGLEPQPGDLDYSIRAGAPGGYEQTGDYDALMRAGGRDVLQDQARRELYSLTGGAPGPGGLIGGAPEMVTGPATAGAPAGGFAQNLGGINLKTLGGLALLGSLSKAPAPVQQAVQQMSPEQREYFNRPSVSWDWNRMMQDANRAGMGLSEYMAAAWPQITSGQYNAQVAMYRGGSPLSQMSYLVRGGGSGRDDTIDAKVSNGEYVMDAETVAMLGDGSTDEGARRLDQMRSALRQHKGKALAKGKFSPNAKSPLAYLKKVA